MVKISKVIFPVAGLGTRFLPATKAVPKEMLPVTDKPLIQWAVEEAAEAGIEEFIFVSAPHKTTIMQHFAAAPAYEEALQKSGQADALNVLKAGLPPQAKITEIHQPAPLGLGHAIWCAKDAVGDAPFAVILPDDMVLAKTGCLKQMLTHYQKTGGNLVAIEKIAPDQTSRYGIIAPQENSADQNPLPVKGLVEKPAPENAPSDLAIIGRYILDPSVMRQLDTPQKGAGGEIQLTDALAALIGQTPLHACHFTGKRYDCGSKAGWLAANLAYGLSDDNLRDSLNAHIKELAKK